MNDAPLRTLLIEDHVSTAQTLSRMLFRRGYTVTVAGDAEQATQAAKTGTFDLIISDIGLPGTNGWDLLPQLQQLCPGVLAIAVSGFAYPNDIQKSSTVGFHLHLKKPLTIEELDTAIQSLFPDRTFPAANDERAFQPRKRSAGL